MSSPGRGQRRERNTIDGVLHLRCYGAFHGNGEWLRSDRFRSRGINSFDQLCRECAAYKSAHDRGYDRRSRLDLVRKWVWEIVHRCGGINAAARTLGVSHVTVLRWLGRSKGYEQRWIRRSSVQHVLEVLADLRSGAIQPSIGSRNGYKTFHHGCRGCGCPLDLYTPGCGTCVDRQYKRARREEVGS